MTVDPAALRDVLRRVQAPAARHRRAGDDRLDPLARRRRRPGGRDPGAVPAVQAPEAGAPAPGRAAAPHQHPVHQHDLARAGAGVPRRRGSSSGASGGSSAGTPRRWSSAATAASPGIGGHLATYASAATLYEVGFNWFFKGRENGGPGDQIFYQGHAAPGIYARAFLEGRITEEQLDHFRRETPPQNGLSLVPAPAPDARVLGVPDGLDGPRPDRRDLPGPVQPLPPEPRARRHVGQPRLGVPRRRRDRRAGGARRPAASPAARASTT